MPPKQRYTREEVIATALDVARKDGLSAVTARDLGKRLGCSSSPVFTAFRNMEEVITETVKAAREMYNDYIEKGLAKKIAFKGAAMQYIRFARNEPRLFDILFMTAGEKAFSLDDILPAIDENSDRILKTSQKEYGLSRETAYRLYQDMWIFTHGIACLYATGVSSMSEAEANERLTEVFAGLLNKLKSDNQGTDSKSVKKSR